ncbi:MAG: nuclease-related domain-containing protein [Pseudomonadota bacterium]
MSAIFDAILEAVQSPSLAFWPVYVSALALLLTVVLVVRWWRGRRVSTIAKSIAAVSIDQLSDVVLPKADDGEIHIAHVLLTERGILVVDVRDISGIVFGSDKMRDWTIMQDGRRFTIPNPQEALLDRIAAVKLAVGKGAVDGCVIFSDAADFSKGRPSLVRTESDFRKEWAIHEPNMARAAHDVAWTALRDAAFRA